jgi:hypothetical protein
MIVYVYGDMFYSPARVLLNPVNTVGTMGGDIDGDFKRFYPDMYERYRTLCEEDAFDIGQFYLYKTPHKWVINMPIRKHFRAHAKLEYIQKGLQKIANNYAELGITSLSMPALDEDDLAWEDVNDMVVGMLGSLPLTVYVHRALIADGIERHPHGNLQPMQPRHVRAIRTWLQHIPQPITYAQIMSDLGKLAQTTSHWRSVQGETFRLRINQPKGKGQQSLKITPTKHEPVFLSGTALRDLWRYVRRAGYVFPDYLPSGLAEHSDYLVAILGASVCVNRKATTFAKRLG